MKKWLKAALCVLLAILLIVGGYVAYVFIDYHRIGDMALTPSEGGAAAVQTDTPYTVQHRLRRLRGRLRLLYGRRH